MGVGAGICENVSFDSSDFKRYVFRARLANSAIKLSKLCTGRSSGVVCVAFFAFADALGCAGRTGSRRGRAACKPGHIGYDAASTFTLGRLACRPIQHKNSRGND